MRRFRAALFDWDMTLLNSRRINYLSMVKIFQEFGLEPPSEREYYAGISSNYMNFYWAHGVPRSADRDTLNEIRRNFMEKNWREASLFEDTFPALLTLRSKGFKIGVISGESSDILEKRIKLFRIDKLLHRFVGDAVDKKFLIWDTLEMFGMEPEECFFVDDSPRDLVQIKESGVYTIGITRDIRVPSDFGLVEPDMVVDSLDEILSLADTEG